MQLQNYLFFNGRCEEAIEFYKRTLGAEVQMLMRNKEAPEQPPPGMLPPGSENKIMHASIKIGDSVLMASDGEQGVQGARRGWQGHDAARQDVLRARLRHADRSLRPRLDGDLRALTRPTVICSGHSTVRRERSFVPNIRPFVVAATLHARIRRPPSCEEVPCPTCC